jgi:heme-degrading monooxygenase HmoA
MAFCRITFVKLKPDVSLEETRKIWDESVVPSSKDQNGFIGSCLLVTEKRDEALALTLWENKDNALAGEKSTYYQDQVKKFIPFFAGPPERKYYEVNSEIVFNKDLEAKVASLTFTKAKPGVSVEEIREIWDSSIAPDTGGQKGLVLLFLLVSEQRDEGISFGLWESKEDAEAIQKSGLYREQVKMFSVFIESVEGRKFYDVNSEIVFLKEIEAV